MLRRPEKDSTFSSTLRRPHAGAISQDANRLPCCRWNKKSWALHGREQRLRGPHAGDVNRLKSLTKMEGT